MAPKKEKETLLVAVDFTLFSEEALIFAGKLANKLQAQILVLHVIHDPAEAPGFYNQKMQKEMFLRSMEEAAHEMMEEFLQKMKKTCPDQTPIQQAVPLLVSGTPVTRIIEIGEKKQVSMIIVGSHGRTGLSHVLIGSKAERLVRLSPIPVIVIKPSKKT
ncbi:MAG: universal stress protein [Deltaproteobacteria bacterium]|nr:universal stress protein [Deltaproteobacteria bacterium]